ncbi:hypothetical protein CTI12_AA517190 [Artemisia annua]|uniref:DNA helicase Pif1-like protein n=1 Tax=Artemisia annua TaxID=35608 RepID=A0A2U1L7Q0_ARTAN|nr:hypothetical protein CTI12_AA517190 [Artemisia annua]
MERLFFRFLAIFLPGVAFYLHRLWVGSPTSDGRCLQQPRKRGWPRKEIVTKETANCDMPGANVQSHNSHTESQTENQQLSLHQCKQAQKRNRDPEQFSRRRIRQRSLEAHVHTTGEPPTTETETTCVHTNGQPDAPQTGDYTNRRSRRTKRHGILMQNFQYSSQSHVNTIEEGSSSCTPQGTFPVYDDLGDCSERCPYCGAAFWFGERLMGNGLQSGPPQYRLCCGGATQNNKRQVAEHDVPEFKVRLYSGDRPRGYELPASQTLGAIVFYSGPESESNYDVILEYRNGVVKRVSKIHKLYMSLQFPLIFIYGQPGYHTKLMLRTADPNDEPKREKAIVCPKNETADTINSQVLSMVHEASAAPLALTDKDSTEENKERQDEAHTTATLLSPPSEKASAAPLALTDKDSTEENKERQDEAHTTATLLSPPSESTKETKLPENDLQQPNNPLLHNEASSALPGTPMEFIQQETLPPPLKEKAIQESKVKTVKRPLFQQQPAESKKQKGIHHIFN